MNGFALVVLVALLVDYVLDLTSGVLTLRALTPTVPPEFEDTIDRERYARSQAYTRSTVRFALVRSTVSLVLLLGVWHTGGFAWLDRTVRTLGHGPVVSGLLFIGALALAGLVAGLPFRIYRTFVLEARFGFNRTTPAVFAADTVKSLILGAGLGGTLVAGILVFFEWAGPTAWIWCWGVSVGFLLVVQFLAPTVILPLFNTFTPLQAGALRDALIAYARSADFPLRDIFVVDGSRRSSKANAFFTGFGRHKRIGLFDTLIERHTVPELVAVVAHEVGHYKRGHVVRGLGLQIGYLGSVFLLMSLVLRDDRLFAAFYVPEASVYAGLVFFGLLFRPVDLVLSPLLHAVSRRNEYEADRFAASTTGGAESLIAALKKLSADRLANLTPHRLEVVLSYSHPPVVARVRALRARTP